MPLNELARLAQPHGAYVVVGAGKTGMDACLWLLEQGVDPDAIVWIMPRDAWLIDRANVQAGDEFFDATWSSMTRQLEAVAAAQDVPDLMLRLEAAGELLRIDPAVLPTAYHGATVSQAELAQLRRMRHIVRLGHVQSIEAGRLELEHGSVAVPPDALVVDCSAVGIPSAPSVPVWQGPRITPQWVRTFGTVFSAAFIAHVEAHLRRRGAEERAVHADRAAELGQRLAATARGEHEQPAALVEAPAAAAVARRRRA